jgi:serine protease
MSARIIAGFAALVALIAGAGAAAPYRHPAGAPASDRIIIQWRARGVAAMQIESIEGRAARLQATSGQTLHAARNIHDKLDVLRLERALPAAALQATVARLRLDPSVEYAEVDARVYVHAFPLDAPDDPRFLAGSDAIGSWRGQWYLQDGLAQNASTATPAAIGVTTAWRTTTGSPGIIVAVLDSGIEFNHPDLGSTADGGPLLPGFDFVTCDDGTDFCTDPTNVLIANDGDGWDPDPTDPGDWIEGNDLNAASGVFKSCALGESDWHGTRVASIIAARTNNAAGMASIAPGVLILPVRVLGKCAGYMSDVIAAMRWAAGLSVTGVATNPYPATIINLSLGTARPCSTAEQSAINEIKPLGVVIVASAGNDGGPVNTPANCQGVLAVAGLRHAGTKVGYSSVSSAAATVSIAAPAGNCVNIGAGSECLYSIEAASNDGKTLPGNPLYTYSVFAPGYGGNSRNVASVGTSFAAPMVSGVAALMASVNPNLTPALLATRMQSAATSFPTPAVDENGAALSACTVRATSTDSQGKYTDIPTNPTACVCTTATCGAGMVNAAAAVAAALLPIAGISASDHSGSIGQTITLDGSASTAAPGHRIATWAWSSSPSVDFANANQPVARFVFPALRPITVKLTITDEGGRQDSASLTINSSTGIGSGGGGACGAELAVLAALALARWRRRNLN